MGVGMIKSKLCCVIKATIKCSDCGALSCKECWASSTEYMGHSKTPYGMECPVTNNPLVWKDWFERDNEIQLLVKVND